MTRDGEPTAVHVHTILLVDTTEYVYEVEAPGGVANIDAARAIALRQHHSGNQRTPGVKSSTTTAWKGSRVARTDRSTS